MGTAAGRPDEGLIRRLAEGLGSLSFGQLVRLLELRDPERPSLAGADAAPGAGVAVLRPDITGRFATGEVAAVDAGAAPPVVVVALAALAGRRSALPEAAEAWLLRVCGPAMRSELDGWQHRLFALRYRAWRDRRPWLAAERWLAQVGGGPVAADPLDAPEPFASALRALAGAEGRPAAIPARAAVGYPAAWPGGARPAVAVEELLEDYFGVGVQVLPHRPRPAPGGSRPDGVRLRLGPMPAAEVPRFLPAAGPGTADGDAVRPLEEWTRRLAGPALEVDWEVERRAPAAPDCVVSARGTARLGWTTWLSTKRQRPATERAPISARVRRAQPPPC